MTDAMPFLGRCRECDYVLFADAADAQRADSLRDVTPGALFRTARGYVGRCFSGHKVFPLRQIQGTYSADHACDARCMNARGHTCTCSCGGVNHGRGHAAAALPAVNRDAPHLGQPGRRITGDVAVIGRRTTQSGYVVFTFAAVATGAQIVWFINPDRAPDDFTVGRRFKMRALVKRHDADDQRGNSTVVTYVEVAGD